MCCPFSSLNRLHFSTVSIRSRSSLKVRAQAQHLQPGSGPRFFSSGICSLWGHRGSAKPPLPKQPNCDTRRLASTQRCARCTRCTVIFSFCYGHTTFHADREYCKIPHSEIQQSGVKNKYNPVLCAGIKALLVFYMQVLSVKISKLI